MSLSFLSEGKFIALGEIISKNLFFYFLKNQKSTNYTPITSWSVFDEKAIRQNSSAESSASNFITPSSQNQNRSRLQLMVKPESSRCIVRQNMSFHPPGFPLTSSPALWRVPCAFSLFFPPDSFFNRMSAVCRMPACTTNWMMDLIEWWLSFMPRSSSQIENSLPKVWVW